MKIEDRRVGIYNPVAMWGYALDGDTGGELFRIYLGGDGLGGIGGGAAMYAAPITCEVKGKQHVSMSSGSALFTFFLPE